MEVIGLTGITPAYAGKSILIPEIEGLDMDHPRIRGEKLIFVIISTFQPGSPPHTRGKATEYG